MKNYMSERSTSQNFVLHSLIIQNVDTSWFDRPSCYDIDVLVCNTPAHSWEEYMMCAQTSVPRATTASGIHHKRKVLHFQRRISWFGLVMWACIWLNKETGQTMAVWESPDSYLPFDLPLRALALVLHFFGGILFRVRIPRRTKLTASSA